MGTKGAGEQMKTIKQAEGRREVDRKGGGAARGGSKGKGTGIIGAETMHAINGDSYYCDKQESYSSCQN